MDLHEQQFNPLKEEGYVGFSAPTRIEKILDKTWRFLGFFLPKRTRHHIRCTIWRPLIWNEMGQFATLGEDLGPIQIQIISE